MSGCEGDGTYHVHVVVTVDARGWIGGGGWVLMQKEGQWVGVNMRGWR